MARYILIDSASGYIFGDTADLAAWRESEQTPEAAARLLDESIGVVGRSYELRNRDTSDGQATGYHIYRADAYGSEQVGDIPDGQDQEMIDAVQRDCEYVGFVACSDTLVYTYRTDAAHCDTEYASEAEAIEAAIESGEWAAIGSSQEARDIDDGAWLCIYEDGVPVTTRGTMA